MAKEITEQEEIRRGKLVAETLRLEKDKNGHYSTTWGTKSDLGVYRVVKRLMEEGK